MEIIIAAVVLVGLCVFGLCFRKMSVFPEYDVEAKTEYAESYNN